MKTRLWIIFLFLVTQPASAFVVISNAGVPSVWKNGLVRYVFHTDTSGYFDGGKDSSGTITDEFKPIRSGFLTWKNVSGINLKFEENASVSQKPSSSDGINTIIWIRKNWKQLDFRPPTNALAVTLLAFDVDGKISDSDMYINAESFSWAVVDSSSESKAIDVQNVTTHEIGHIIGMDHSSEDLFEENETLLNATMYFAANPGETLRRQLGKDDILGVKSLYGNSNLIPPQVNSLDLVGQSGGIATYRIRGENFGETTGFILTKNNVNIFDSVSRYHTITSSSEALIKFDISSFPEGDSTLVVFNEASQLTKFNISLKGGNLTANTTSAQADEGGCFLQTQPISPWVGILWLSFTGFLFFLRRRISVFSDW